VVRRLSRSRSRSIPDDSTGVEQCTPPEPPRAPPLAKRGVHAPARRTLFGDSCSSTTTSVLGHDRDTGLLTAAGAAASSHLSLSAMSTQATAVVVIQAAARRYFVRSFVVADGIAGGLECYLGYWAGPAHYRLAQPARIRLLGLLPGAYAAAAKLQAAVRCYLCVIEYMYTLDEAHHLAWCLAGAWRARQQRVLARAALQNAGGLSPASAEELRLIRLSRLGALPQAPPVATPPAAFRAETWRAAEWAVRWATSPPPADYSRETGDHRLPPKTEAVVIADVARRAAALAAGDTELAWSIASVLETGVGIKINDKKRTWRVTAPFRLTHADSRRGRKKAAAPMEDEFDFEDVYDDMCMRDSFNLFMSTADSVMGGAHFEAWDAC